MTSPLEISQVAAQPIVNIAAYKFVPLADLPDRREQLRSLCFGLELKGTILLSPEGINLFLAGERANVDEFLTQLQSDPAIGEMDVKESLSEKQPFQRMIVRLKKEIIAFGVEGVAPQIKTSPKLPAKVLKQWLDEGRPVHLLDTRNDYEVQLGTFQGAIDLGITHFREFPEACERLPPEFKKQPIVMFCTGGIRCEKAGPCMENLGFEEIYQLEGGILKYFEECSESHYDGDCFVFDQRVALKPDLQPSGHLLCFACQATLTHEDISDERFVFAESCPHCYRTPEERLVENLKRRKLKLESITSPLPGSVPYNNRRPMFVSKHLADLNLLDFLVAFYPPYSREQWEELVKLGRIERDGEIIDASTTVREGDRLWHNIPDTVEPDVSNGVEFLYEDDEIVVLHKPAPLPCHPSGRYFKNSLVSFLEPIYRPQKLRLLHRLDANTSGLVLLARKHAPAVALSKMFENREVKKTYWARVTGHPPQDEFRCEAPIARDPEEAGARQVDQDGQPAVTEFRVLKRFGDGTSLIEVNPITGRTNQIRVHLWHLGWPIVGDPTYLAGGQQGTQQTLAVDAPPLCLRAMKLEFKHPASKKVVSFDAPRPEWAE